MCVSSRFCEEYLPLLFSVFDDAQEPVIRSNIVIALGDVAVCFSNMIDENRFVLFSPSLVSISRSFALTSPSFPTSSLFPPVIVSTKVSPTPTSRSRRTPSWS